MISAFKTSSRERISQVVVGAKSDNLLAKLKLPVAAIKPVMLSPVTKNTDGTFTLGVLSEDVQTSMTVTSNLSGSASQAM